MKANVGGNDKIIRIIIGLIGFIIGLLAKSWWGLFGFIPLLTGLFNFCPLYAVLKISTAKTDN